MTTYVSSVIKFFMDFIKIMMMAMITRRQLWLLVRSNIWIVMVLLELVGRLPKISYNVGTVCGHAWLIWHSCPGERDTTVGAGRLLLVVVVVVVVENDR